MSKIKVSIVSYLNSKPFIYGLQQSNLINEIDLSLDMPSICSQKLLENKVDIGLIPVATIPHLKEKYIISDYCIGAVGKVNSVVLYSDVPLQKIEKIILDYQSRTSVQLVKILAKEYWKINPLFESGDIDYENKINGSTAAVIIGDRTFGLSSTYKYEYDLSEEWFKFTNLPFVFACWVTNKKLPIEFLEKFNAAIRFGIENKEVLIRELEKAQEYVFDIRSYLNKYISFEFDSEKKQGLELFLSYLPK
jgi:chorismate dehydratase